MNRIISLSLVLVLFTISTQSTNGQEVKSINIRMINHEDIELVDNKLESVINVYALIHITFMDSINLVPKDISM